ncbi:MULTISPECIES: dihydrofolate reductase family protein [Mumia]|uniref:dihydrofolate reductase family protein n=1 Tax=Mumia TaxID=1546255 RepID=UPI0014237507|nr:MULTISPECIES: dihydrofolate reductase family protein [unclassified Mumia]QMW67009.1 dihydrofolate reductase family protein [Mumia sp. ZJ1417]
MATSLYHSTASLDGFITGPDEEIGFLVEPAMGDNALVDALTARPYGGAWEGPIVVHTHDPDEPPAEGIVFVTGTVEDAYAVAAEAAGDKYVVVLGAVTARRLLEAGLLDEVMLHVVPRFVGAGTPVLDAPEGLPVRLDWISRSTSGEIQNLWARVIG